MRKRNQTRVFPGETLERRDFLSADPSITLPMGIVVTEPPCYAHVADAGDDTTVLNLVRPEPRQDSNVHSPANAEIDPQYVVHQPPRLQPGNMPLAGTPAFTGKDQIDILWQTMTVDVGTLDEFVVEIRKVGDETWQNVPLNAPLDTGVQTRMIHSATATGLDWYTRYEYRVHHDRAGERLVTYHDSFMTRRPQGDDTPFTFVAYGDSAARNQNGDGFRAVQSRINQLQPEFAVLLGDNFYDFGSHEEADARFTSEQNPAAAAWAASHLDWMAIGNHDSILNATNGQPTRDSFSVPIQIAGVNAVAQPPDGEPAENNYSWDYGNVHFVAIDSNPSEISASQNGPERMEAILDYLVADMAASTATWKIVHMHHPLIGTEKSLKGANSPYFQAALPRLRAAGVDLIMTGDSHTFSWTYPLLDFGDVDGNGQVEISEVEFAAGDPTEFKKDEGLVQLVAGVGGRSLRSYSYPDPFTAGAYSTDRTTGPIENGFAQLEVTPDRLRISYISAETGQIVGDTNMNGVRDVGETHFGQFEIVDSAVMRADFNGNGQLGAADINLLCAAIRADDQRPEYDVDGDGQVSRQDYHRMINGILAVQPGDANLDGVANSQDLVQVFVAGKYENHLPDSAGWEEGDWDCSGTFESHDLIEMLIRGYRA